MPPTSLAARRNGTGWRDAMIPDRSTTPDTGTKTASAGRGGEEQVHETSGSWPLGSSERPLRVAVIGSGPSGFYAIAALFKADGLEADVDLFDRLPTPFGLVRGGVAPDHQKIKNVIRVYNRTAQHDRFRFFGNVELGRDISVDDLRRHYDHIVYATGNESDRKMGIPGEDLPGVHSATEFVGWYNGHPDFQDRSFDLASARRVAVVGNGNVAMDVTRVLARSPDELAPTDITAESLAVLRESRVEEVILLGRRGPAQAAFSPQEIKEVGSLEGVNLLVSEAEMDLDEISSTWLEESAAPSARRNVTYLSEIAGATAGDDDRLVTCRFLVSPIDLQAGDDGRVRRVVIEKNELYAAEDGTPRPRGTGETETLDVDLVFKAVGYRGVPLPGVPFHERWGILPNDEGRLQTEPDGEVVPGQYVVGWAKRGPTGLIGTNSPDSTATVKKMLEDIDGVTAPADPAGAPERIVELLRERGVDFVSFDDWNRLDEDEVRLGEAQNKVREKYTDVESMMAAVNRLR